ncbi:MAG: hypothetical protein Q9174_003772 [Haloplaca sp. 1 TL-2023]
MDHIKSWLRDYLEGAVIEQKTYHGQLRFSVPAQTSEKHKGKEIEDSTGIHSSGVGALFTMLETHKEELGFQYYSVSATTLDQVFLSIVGKHNIEEENYGQEAKKRQLWKRILARRS